MRRGSVSSWEPWARRNSANMAQIAGNRSEFTTSDLGLSDIEYKRNGGCFMSHKKTASMVVIFILFLLIAGVVGAYISPWGKKQTLTDPSLLEEDEIDGHGAEARFTVSSSILPTLYTIELTPVLEDDVVKKIKGRVVVQFDYNDTQPMSKIVINAGGITVSKTKLLSLNEHPVGNVHARRRRDAEGDAAVTNPTVAVLTDSDSTAVETVSSNSTDGNVTNVPNSAKAEDSDQAVMSTTVSLDAEAQGTEISIASDETDSVGGFYVVNPGTPIQRGAYSMEITYEAKIDGTNTFVNTYEIEGQKRWLLGTNLKPLGARTLFPGFDEPGSRARFSLSVARPKSLVSLANMPLQSSESVSDDWVMDHFEKSPPLSSHNIAFLVGDLQPIGETTAGETKTPLTLWGGNSTMNDTGFIAEKIGSVTKSLNEFFSVPLSLPKLDVVAVPGLTIDGAGSTGLIFIRESLFYLTNETSDITKESAIKNLITLIGEQWLGGLVGARTWSDAWILEGSLIYLQHLLADKIEPSLDAYPSFGMIQHGALESDTYAASTPLESELSPAILETLYPQNVFRKGACLIRMLHTVVSDSGLRSGYKRFISGWNSTSPRVSDFWNSMSEEAQWLPDGVSFAEVMTPWVNQGGFPVITVTRNYETGSAIVRQEQFSYDNSSISKQQFWYVPLTYITEDDDWSAPRKSWFKQEQEITLDNLGQSDDKKWVLFNVNQTGYYRVNYDVDNWKLLSSALNSSFDKFPVTTRTSLVDDALSLAWGGRLEYATALDLIRYLEARETHHSPWTVAFQNMVKLDNLLHSSAAYFSFQEFMIKFISPMLKKTTSTSAETQMKLMAIKWACLVDNPECRNYVKSLETVPKYLEQTVQCTLVKFGGKSEWKSMLNKTLNADKETRLKLLSALPCSQLEWILESLFNDILKGEKYDVAETLILLKGIGENPVAARLAFKFVRRHWDVVHERFSKSYPIAKAFLIASMKGIIDDQDLKDFQSFKQEYHDKLKFMGHTIAIAEAEARSRSSWLRVNLVAVQGWLENYTKTSL